MNVTTGSSATTIFVGGPCGGCGHPQDVHDVVCADPEWPDDMPMCLDCIGDARDEESTRPAFHAYARTPLLVSLSDEPGQGEKA